jgi:hypothetical protein
MPQESRLFVKTSLVALALAFVWGAVMALGESLGYAWPPAWPIEHAHLASVGWLVNLVIGIALWMLPLARDRYPTTSGRYPVGIPYAIWALLNGGLLARIVAEPLVADSTPARVALALGSLAQVAAIVLFSVVAWHRVRPPSHPAPGVR